MRKISDIDSSAQPLKLDQAYIIGAALGDGNLSCPNGKATRLRISCDSRYTKISEEIISSLKRLFPKNQVSIVYRKKTIFDISVYSNDLNKLLPWVVGKGTKHDQNARVPSWIFDNKACVYACLKGLIHTDGSIYLDRGYRMVNFANNVSGLAYDVQTMMQILGSSPHMYTTPQKSGKPKYTVRLSKESEQFIKEVGIAKN